ncbi:MAG: hypothetical protein VYC40_05445 [Pseudomonadota bacterium]|nr:hypothetical protein [Pseudomonadota bacterium]
MISKASPTQATQKKTAIQSKTSFILHPRGGVEVNHVDRGSPQLGFVLVHEVANGSPMVTHSLA